MTNQEVNDMLTAVGDTGAAKMMYVGEAAARTFGCTDEELEVARFSTDRHIKDNLYLMPPMP